MSAAIPSSYTRLIAQLPLRPLRSANDYRAATAMVERLTSRENQLDRGEADYLEVLSGLIEAYDARHFSTPMADVGPIDILKELMRQAGMKSADLGKLLGSKGLASDILNGKRQLSKTHIVILGERFGVEPGLFLPASSEGRKAAKRSA